MKGKGENENARGNRWTKEQDEFLVAQARAGKSATQLIPLLKDKFGIKVTRSAVIARMTRIREAGGVEAAQRKTIAQIKAEAESWSEEEDELLRVKRKEGLSFHGVYLVFRQRYPGRRTRSAIASRAVRLGLDPHGTPEERAQNITLAARLTYKVNKLKHVGDAGEPERTPADVKLLQSDAWKPIEGSRQIQIWETRPGLCKWPLGERNEGTFSYCGADCDVARTYCEHHHQLSLPKDKRAAA